ncbi:MAG: ABC transporter substrate-binding protein [Fusobacteriaceae bacterium]
MKNIQIKKLNKNRNIGTKIIIGLTFLTVLENIATANEHDSEKKKNIVVAQGSKPRSLDPYKYNEFPALMITEHIYNNLITLDNDGSLVPDLAISWKIISPKEIEFELRKDVKFHNGNDFKSNDVVYSFNRMKAMPGSGIAVDNLENIVAIDDYKVKLILKSPSSPFIASLASPLLGIMDEEYSSQNEDKIGVSPNGTGPFIFKDWKDGERVILESNKNYFNGAPKIDGLTFWIITETPNRIIALETGEAQIAYAVSPFDADKMKNHKDIRLETKLTATTDYLGLNTNKKILGNPALRKAINIGIDKQSIIDSILFGKGQVAKSIVNPKIWGSSEDSVGWYYNKEKAKELIKNNGLEGTELSLWVSDNPTRVQVAQIIQANLKEIGLDIKINAVEWGTFLQKTAMGEHDLLLTTWFIGAPDADTILRSLIYSKSAGSGGNRSFYYNQDVDHKLEDAAESFDPKKRLELYWEIQDIVSKESPVIPIVHKYDTMAFSRKVKNYQYNRATLRNLFEVIDIED